MKTTYNMYIFQIPFENLSQFNFFQLSLVDLASKLLKMSYGGRSSAMKTCIAKQVGATIEITKSQDKTGVYVDLHHLRDVGPIPRNIENESAAHYSLRCDLYQYCCQLIDNTFEEEVSSMTNSAVEFTKQFLNEMLCNFKSNFMLPTLLLLSNPLAQTEDNICTSISSFCKKDLNGYFLTLHPYDSMTILEEFVLEHEDHERPLVVYIKNAESRSKEHLERYIDQLLLFRLEHHLPTFLLLSWSFFPIRLFSTIDQEYTSKMIIKPYKLPSPIQILDRLFDRLIINGDLPISIPLTLLESITTKTLADDFSVMRWMKDLKYILYTYITTQRLSYLSLFKVYFLDSVQWNQIQYDFEKRNDSKLMDTDSIQNSEESSSQKRVQTDEENEDDGKNLDIITTLIKSQKHVGRPRKNPEKTRRELYLETRYKGRRPGRPKGSKSSKNNLIPLTELNLDRKDRRQKSTKMNEEMSIIEKVKNMTYLNFKNILLSDFDIDFLLNTSSFTSFLGSYIPYHKDEIYYMDINLKPFTSVETKEEEASGINLLMIDTTHELEDQKMLEMLSMKDQEDEDEDVAIDTLYEEEPKKKKRGRKKKNLSSPPPTQESKKPDPVPAPTVPSPSDSEEFYDNEHDDENKTSTIEDIITRNQNQLLTVADATLPSLPELGKKNVGGRPRKYRQVYADNQDVQADLNIPIIHDYLQQSEGEKKRLLQETISRRDPALYTYIAYKIADWMTDYCLFSKVKLYAFTFYKQFVLLVKKNASNRDIYLELYSDQYQEGFFYKTIISQMYKMTNQEIDSFLVNLLSLIDSSEFKNQFECLKTQVSTLQEMIQNQHSEESLSLSPMKRKRQRTTQADSLQLLSPQLVGRSRSKMMLANANKKNLEDTNTEEDLEIKKAFMNLLNYILTTFVHPICSPPLEDVFTITNPAILKSIKKTLNTNNKGYILSNLREQEKWINCTCCTPLNITCHNEDICVCYEYYINCSKYINIQEWYLSFYNYYCKQRLDHHKYTEEEIKDRFLDSLTTLEFLGFITRSSNELVYIKQDYSNDVHLIHS